VSESTASPARRETSSPPPIPHVLCMFLRPRSACLLLKCRQANALPLDRPADLRQRNPMRRGCDGAADRCPGQARFWVAWANLFDRAFSLPVPRWFPTHPGIPSRIPPTAPNDTKAHANEGHFASTLRASASPTVLARSPRPLRSRWTLPLSPNLPASDRKTPAYVREGHFGSTSHVVS